MKGENGNYNEPRVCFEMRRSTDEKLSTKPAGDSRQEKTRGHDKVQTHNKANRKHESTHPSLLRSEGVGRGTLRRKRTGVGQTCYLSVESTRGERGIWIQTTTNDKKNCCKGKKVRRVQEPVKGARNTQRIGPIQTRHMSKIECFSFCVQYWERICKGR